MRNRLQLLKEWLLMTYIVPYIQWSLVTVFECGYKKRDGCTTYLWTNTSIQLELLCVYSFNCCLLPFFGRQFSKVVIMDIVTGLSMFVHACMFIMLNKTVSINLLQAQCLLRIYASYKIETIWYLAKQNRKKHFLFIF